MKHTQSVILYDSKLKILLYAIKWDNAAFVLYFYKKIEKKIKNAIIAMDRPESL